MSDEKKSVWELLRGRYPKNTHALIAEVSNKAGFERSRSLDYISISFWPSRGLSIHGIEQKSSRSDWQNEMKNPKKSEDFIKHCDRFWLLTTNDKVAQLSEIPETWGWMMVKGSRLMTMKEAPKLKPEEITKSFAICLIRRAVEDLIHKSEIQAHLEEATESGKRMMKYEVESSKREQEASQKVIDEFAKESGIDIRRRRWELGDIGKAVKIIMDINGHMDLRSRIVQEKNIVEKYLERLNKSLQDYEANNTQPVDSSEIIFKQ